MTSNSYLLTFPPSLQGSNSAMEQTISNPPFRHSLLKPLSKSTNYTNYPTTSPLLRLNTSTYLQHSLNLHSQASANQIHAHIIKTGENWLSHSLIFNLIQLCSEFGYTHSAAMLLFAGLDSGFLSISLLSDVLHEGREDPTNLLKLFQQLHRAGSLFNAAVLRAALKVCGNCVGLQTHALIVKSGFGEETLLRCSLMDLYGDCMSLEYTNKLFEEAMVKCSVLWNKFVTINAEKESWWKSIEVFRRMQSVVVGVKADEVTIAKVLNACGRVEALVHGKEIHGHAIRSGFSSDLLVSNSLITMYSKNSCIYLARRVFDSIGNKSVVSWNSMISCCSLNGFLDDAMEVLEEMLSSKVEPDLVTWNCLISGYSHSGYAIEVFDLFRRMQTKGLKPNSSTVTSVLRTISESNSIRIGKEMHAYVMRHGLESSVYIGTALVNMHLKCSGLIYARRFFDSMKYRNVVTWNTLISGYAYGGFLDEALELLKRMDREEGISPNLTTWNGLISGYSMKGQSNQALLVLRKLKVIGLRPNVVSWTALISGCCQNEQYKESLYLLTEMVNEGIEPNSATLATLLRACANLALLHTGTELHCFSVRKGFDKDIYVATSLIDMYSKSGSLEKARNVFRNIRNKNLASWNTMLMGISVYGQGNEASTLFDEMCGSGVKPDGITFTALLSSCRHAGLITEGWKYFDEMQSKYGVAPRLEHYTSMVDLLARGGYLDEAMDFIREMPLEPDASLWGAVLGACRTHRNLEISEIAAKYLFKLEPDNSANYLLMMSLYAYENRWEDVENMRIAMNAAGLKSKAGWSWIQIGQNVHVFNVEGIQHPDIGEIYFELYQLVSEMKGMGYVADTSCIVQNVSEEEKERLLMSHTEKLAITYGLICTGKNTVIRVIKNTRVCNDCHTMAKYVSKITDREIYLREGVRFHHFKDGECSCNNYW